MKTLKQVNLKNKKVIVRCDFNVPVKEREILDDVKIKAGLETINRIRDQKPSLLILASHLGRPEGKVISELSNESVAQRLEELLGQEIALIKNLDNLKELSSGYPELSSSGIFLLENIRFWPGEEANDEEFAKGITEDFDVYVNDAFSVSHRKHSSIVSFPEFAKEKCAGLLFEKEFNKLSQVKDAPTHPAVMVIGGAKIKTKLPVIENMTKMYDEVLVGGLIANEAIDQKIELGEKVMLPTDFAPAGKEDQRLDIGPKTVAKYVKDIEQADTVVWNGPMGKFEDEDCAEGTRLIMRAIAKNKKATQVIGGGETLEAVKEFGNFSDFDYVSMSGGAMLEFLAGKTLPGLKAME